MLTGNNLIGYNFSSDSKSTFNRQLKLNGESVSFEFHEASDEEIDRAVMKADAAFHRYRLMSGHGKAAFLERIAERIEAAKGELIDIAMQETHLPEARLKGEVQRTVNQAKLFAQLLREGSWVNAIIDTAIPDRTPLPKPDIRQLQIALGPVGVFGASNFPFAFSVAGGDTISALAAGCTVVYKAHPGHPATSEKVAVLINEAAQQSGLPDGIFSMLQGETIQTGQSLVMHPLLKAVAFTGSFRGGKAIFDSVAKREEPIPVYAEMGSINPVFILPRMLAEKSAELASTLASSNLLGVGQFCTNPGIIIQMQSEHSNAFVSKFGELIRESTGDCMLTANIHTGYESGVKRVAGFSDVELIASGKEATRPYSATPHMYKTSASAFIENKELMEEVFGPSSIHVVANEKLEIMKAAENLSGQLTVSVWATDQDLEEFPELIKILELKAGRIIYNAVPTGVEVTHAMVHGGPFPATTDSKTTSVGTNAIYRFTRPVCYQSSPQQFLPEELKNENALGIWRMVNGLRTKEPINQ
jgi:NADP-dependent aldehyde dehydrogenase